MITPIKYSIVRTVSIDKVQNDNGTISPRKTVVDEITLHIDDYVNENVIRSGTLTFADGAWHCEDEQSNALLRAKAAEELWVPRSYIVRVDETGKISSAQGPVSLALLNIHREKNIPIEIATGEMPMDVLQSMMFDGSAVVPRPDNPTMIRGENRTLFIENVPPGSQVSLIVDGVTVPVDDYEIQVDEPGALGVQVVSPWPMREIRYDIQVE